MVGPSEEGVGVNVTANTEQVPPAMERAAAAVEAATKEMTASFEAMAATIEASLGPLIAFIAVFEALHVITDAVEGVADLAVQLDVLRNKTGMTVEELSALRYAADLSHVSIEQLSIGMQRLARNIEQAAKGGAGPAADALKAMNIAATDASGAMRPMNDLLLDIAERFSTMPDGTEKTALAMDLFGRSGAALIPLLDRGRDGIRELEAEARKLGITLTDEDETAALRFHEAMRQLHAIWEAFIRDIVVSSLPALTLLLQTISALVHTIEGLWHILAATSATLRNDTVEAARQATLAMLALQKVVHDFDTKPTPLSSATGEGVPIIPHGGPSAIDVMREEWNKIKEAAIANNEDLLPLEIDFWKQKLATAKEGSKEYIEIHTHLVNLEEQLAKRTTEEQKKAAKETEATWVKTFDALPKAFGDAVRQMRGHAQSFHDFMSDLLASLTRAAIGAGVKMLAHHAAVELAKREITTATALHAVAAAVWTAIKSVAAYAAQAAAATWAAISAIPFVGPLLAPAAAAAALAGVLALAGGLHSAAGGYDVPAGMNPVTQLHAQEMVLPKEYADVIRGMADDGGGGGGGGDTHNYIYAMDASSFADFLSRSGNASAVARAAIAGGHKGIPTSGLGRFSR